MKMNVAYATTPKVGEIANGDRPFYRHDDVGHHLLAVIDGLGHGPEAQAATLAGLRFLEGVALSMPLSEMMLGLHEAMRGTRGAAGAVCATHGAELYACAVGNVELRPVRADVPLIASAGILGVRVQKFRVCSVRIALPCRLVMFSDGLANPTTISEFHPLPPQLACDGLIQRHRRTYDDTTVLIADLE